MNKVEKYKRIYPKLLAMLKEGKSSKTSHEVKDLQDGIASLFKKMSTEESKEALEWWANEYGLKKSLNWSPPAKIEEIDEVQNN